MRAPLVKFPAIDREIGRRPPEQTAQEHARSAEAGVCLFPASARTLIPSIASPAI